MSVRNLENYKMTNYIRIMEQQKLVKNGISPSRFEGSFENL